MTYACKDPGDDMDEQGEAEMRAGLLASYKTREALADALADRISEAADMRREIERLTDAKADATLTARICELEEQLATVNARLGATQGPPLPFPTQDAFNRLSVLHGDMFTLARSCLAAAWEVLEVARDRLTAEEIEESEARLKVLDKRVYGPGRPVPPHATGPASFTGAVSSEGSGQRTEHAPGCKSEGEPGCDCGAMRP